MKRLGVVVFATLAFSLALVAPALAGSDIPPPDGGGGGVAGGGGGGTAFTGANISLGLVLLGALLLLGIGSLIVSRRRAAASR
ncbi:MAG: LPXTG cell wall anchor domain-containing protein [Actinobacteria bacterium]|nr:LPXTG cell wall anchor domain-containing protein [Actinomycetota bacterium]